MDWLLNGSFRIGRFSGINVHVHITFILWTAFRLFDGRGNWQWEAMFSGLLFAIVLIHEFGHCFGARMVGGDAENILMWPLGGLAFAHAPMTPWAQFVTVACGPLVNVIFCVVSAAMLIAATGSFSIVSFNPLDPFGGDAPFTAQWQPYVHLFYAVNFMLLCFNLLPVYPMDGGQLLWTALWPFMGLHRATITAAQIGIIGAVAFGLYGVSTGSGMFIVFAIFGGMTSYRQLMAARHGLVQQEFRSYRSAGRYERRPGWWSRLKARLGGSAHRRTEEAATRNPNPGGWQKKIDEEARMEAEVDRILAKVKDQGMNSLSYVERQTLENATRRKRQAESQAFDRELRL